MKDTYCSLNKSTYLKMGFDKKMPFDMWKEIIKTCNLIICDEVLNNEAGMLLPFNIGRIIILKTLPKVKQMYSVTNPKGEARKIFNLHSFGWVYRVFHKERMLLKFPYLYRFKPNRKNIKKPLYNKIMEGEANFLTAANYNEYYGVC